MNFEGHQLHRIDDCWLFDLTTFVGYHIELNGEKVEDYQRAFIIRRDNENGSYEFDKEIKVPVKIMRKAVNIVERYRKEALLENASR